MERNIQAGDTVEWTRQLTWPYIQTYYGRGDVVGVTDDGKLVTVINKYNQIFHLRPELTRVTVMEATTDGTAAT